MPRRRTIPPRARPLLSTHPSVSRRRRRAHVRLAPRPAPSRVLQRHRVACRPAHPSALSCGSAGKQRLQHRRHKARAGAASGGAARLSHAGTWRRRAPLRGNGATCCAPATGCGEGRDQGAASTEPKPRLHRAASAEPWAPRAPRARNQAHAAAPPRPVRQPGPCACRGRRATRGACE